eukprot:CAMPEP_0117673810 /NCGR_PEP_ID=MMETSP0804-20121206/14682_1 /TAXON_ID=1074897 /ORGANISM="Tetraselmis astigmatica, Strain CCMP880" /LENGTH=162 /DNA_ID=CAMNT_0005482595 /DNA_START=348 /DNA_END=836 /DNA_ORIENTATION=-
MSAVSLLCEGVVDWDGITDVCHQFSAGVAGALFGAGWWVQADALIVQHLTEAGPGASFLFQIPGVLATLSMVMINLTRREDLQNPDMLSEGVECRLKLWLFLSYCMAFGSLFGAVWVLFTCKDAGEHLWLGTAGVIQTVLIVASGLVMWLLRAPSEDYSFGF